MTTVPDPADPTTIGPSTSISMTIDKPIAEVWERFVPVELPSIFPNAKGPIPPVVAVEGQDGRWDEVGRSRVVVLGDRSRVNEAITLSEPSGGSAAAENARFGYVVTGFSGPLGRLAKEARGLWTFHADGNQTKVVWTYAFAPTIFLAHPPLAFIIGTFWKSYMRDGLKNLKALVEG